MAAVASGSVRAYQREVETLLEQIQGHVRELHRLKVFGVRGRGLAERKHELEQARRMLAALVGRAGYGSAGSGSTAAP
jgi:hypothetical protein